MTTASADMSPASISERIRVASELSDLRADLRLHSKIDYSPEGVSRRIREVSELRRLCLSLAQRPSGQSAS